MVHVLAVVCMVLVTSQSLKAQHRVVRQFYDFEKKFVKQVYQAKKGSSDPDGTFVSYYPTGGIQSRGIYEAGKQDGAWTYYFQNGGKKATGNYDRGSKAGIWTYYYESGQISQKGKVKNGDKHGLWQFYYESGALKSEGMVIAEKNEGLWIYYSEDGREKAKANFRSGSGLYKEVYPNGKLRMQGLIRNGGSDSLWTYYYEDGKVKAEGNEKNGLKMGRWRFYHVDGSLMSEGEYLADKENGEWVYYHPNGVISSKGALVSGKKNGQWSLFYDSGRFMGEGNFDNGTGPYREYYDGGKLKVEGQLQNGNNNGLWRYYYPDGNLEGECLYDEGEGDYIGFFPDGSKKISGRLKNGTKTGVWRLYDSEGALSGLYKTYFEKEEEPTIPVVSRKPDSMLVQAPRKNKGKPRLVLPGRKIHFFNAKINELTGIIISANPAALLLGQLPIYGEYYFHKRLGYEIGVTAIRNPLFDSHSERLTTTTNTTFTEGLSFLARQKLYLLSRGTGGYYIAQEVRATFYQYTASKQFFIDSIQRPAVQIYYGNEQRYEFSLLLGRRFFKHNNLDNTLAADVFFGLGVGYRVTSLPNISNIFSDVITSPTTVPIRAGFSLGYFF